MEVKPVPLNGLLFNCFLHRPHPIAFKIFGPDILVGASMMGGQWAIVHPCFGRIVRRRRAELPLAHPAVGSYLRPCLVIHICFYQVYELITNHPP